MLWRSGSDTWSYASYVWNEEQTDATLAPPGGLRGVADIAPGARHSIPSQDDCRTCHDNGATPVLGFTALQLSTDRDPGAAHGEPRSPDMVTLQTLDEDRLFEPRRPEFTSHPPRIPGDARTRAVLGYLSSNCGHCHNERSAVATVRLPLLVPAYASAAQVNAVIETLTAHTTKWDLPHALPGTTSFVRPGRPDMSALFVRMRSRRPSSQMPPLGTVVADRQALEQVSEWIKHLSLR